MGGYTPVAQVWYPDVTDIAKLNTLLATMASSIEDGLGARMTRQETVKSLLGSVTAGSTWTLANGVPANVPYTINAGGFNDGMTLASGVITITTPGLYYFSCSVLTTQTNGYVDLQLQRNGGTFSRALGAGSTAGAGIGPAVAGGVFNCLAGDTVKATVTVNGVTGSCAINTLQATYNVMSAMLMKAL
jgi:hypothetical protein